MGYFLGKGRGRTEERKTAIFVLSFLTVEERKTLKERLEANKIAILKEQIEKRTSTEITGSGDSSKRV
jgi:hypothetical protein